jgi:PAS domain S-box-containing protein
MEYRSEAQFFQAVLGCVADGVFTVDCNWRITSFNRAAERITGLSDPGNDGYRTRRG